MNYASLSDQQVWERMRELREQYICACTRLRQAEDVEFDVRTDLEAIRKELAEREISRTERELGEKHGYF